MSERLPILFSDKGAARGTPEYHQMMIRAMQGRLEVTPPDDPAYAKTQEAIAKQQAQLTRAEKRIAKEAEKARKAAELAAEKEHAAREDTTTRARRRAPTAPDRDRGRHR